MNQRNHIYLKNTVLNYGIIGLSYFFTFLSVPLMLKYLGDFQFGIFQTVLALLMWVSICDLGIGNGLRNKVSEYLSLGQFLQLRKLEGSAFVISIYVSAAMIILGSIFFAFFEPQWLFQSDIFNKNDVTLTFYIAFAFFCLNLSFSLFSSICYGIQQSYVVSLSKLINNIVYCLLLYLLVYFNFQSVLFYASLVYGFSLLLSNLIPFLYLKQKRELWPPIYDKSWNGLETRGLLNVSFNFLFLQISTIVLFSSDTFIIAKLLRVEDVSSYSIVSKVFMFLINIYSILLIQLWNATSEAKVKQDYNWIIRSEKRLKLALIPILIVLAAIIILFDKISLLWLGKRINVGVMFLIFFSVYTVIHCLNGIYVNILNGITRLKAQLIVYSFTAIVNILLSYVFIKYLDWGLNGVVLSKIICVSITLTTCYIDYKLFINKNNSTVAS